jgi:hypothetical protein
MARPRGQALVVTLVGVALATTALVAARSGRATMGETEPEAPPAVPKKAAGEPVAPLWDTDELPGFTTGVAMRPVDRDVFAALRGAAFPREAMVDVFPRRPYRVRFGGSAVGHAVRLVLLDLDRDGRWDERWDLGQPGQVVRRVLPAGHEGGEGVDFTLTHGRWQPH